MRAKNSFIFGLFLIAAAGLMLVVYRIWLPKTTVTTNASEDRKLLELRAPATGIDAIEKRQEVVEETIKEAVDDALGQEGFKHSEE